METKAPRELFALFHKKTGGLCRCELTPTVVNYNRDTDEEVRFVEYSAYEREENLNRIKRKVLLENQEEISKLRAERDELKAELEGMTLSRAACLKELEQAKEAKRQKCIAEFRDWRVERDALKAELEQAKQESRQWYEKYRQEPSKDLVEKLRTDLTEAIGALEKINEDFGTDYADGNVMIANAALTKLRGKA